MKKAMIIILALIMVFASTIYVFADGYAFLAPFNDETHANYGTAVDSNANPAMYVGVDDNKAPMYLRPTYNLYGSSGRRWYWIYDKGVFNMGNKYTNTYVDSETFYINQVNRQNTVLTFAYEIDNTYTGNGRIFFNTANNRTDTVLFNNPSGTNVYRYKDKYIIGEHYTLNNTGYVRALSVQINTNDIFDTNKFHVIEGNATEMENYLDGLEREFSGSNGLTGIINPIFTVKAGYALILELDGANTLGISQTIDTNGYKASAPMWGKWRWGHYERFGNDLAFNFNFNSSEDIVWTKNGGTILNPAKTGYHVTDMGASTNYKYYMFANPPLPVAAEHNGNPGVPVTVRVNGTIKRSILYPLQENVWEQSYSYDTNRTDVITYVDNNGALEEREVTGIDITGENPTITATNEQVGNITSQKELNYNDDTLTGGLNDLLNKNNDTSKTITESFGDFFNNIRSIFTWLPNEVYTVCVGMFSIILAVYVIKLFR